MKQVKIFEDISEIDAESWNKLILDDFPFSTYGFLKCLEDSHCLGQERGWSPRYFCIYEDKDLIAATWGYVKDHSYGEYIFDWEWAEIHYRFGLDYYPKFLSAIPFTPATGQKILLAEELSLEDQSAIAETLVQSVDQFCKTSEMSSCHFLFTNENDGGHLEAQDFKTRYSYQFHWHNNEYHEFEDFLNHLRRKRRQQVLRERQRVEEQGISVRFLEEDELNEANARIMYQLYLSTIDDKMAAPYLSEEFFINAFDKLKDIVLVNFAFLEDEVVAGSIAFKGKKKLFGRYWGAFETFDCLHFEVCYYSYIEWAIKNSYQLFEAGAQGPHKHPRGFLPKITRSQHKIYNDGIAEPIYRFLGIERTQLEAGIEDVKKNTPFRRDES